MTVCIAARVLGNNPALILCMDLKGSVEWSSSETTHKWIPLRHGFHAQIAGQVSRAKELAHHCEDALPANPVTQRDIVQALRKGIGTHKRALADEYTQGKLGISYEEFRKKGKTWIPEDIYREMSWEIKNQYATDELIVSGFIGRDPYIFKVSSDHVITCDDFAVIGSGTALSEASLLQRSQNINQGKDLTIYQVYEAKKLAERADAVGTKTRIVIIWGDGSKQYVNDIGFDLLKARFAQFSPQPINTSVSLPKESFGVVV